jgi:hypothetical protein
MYNYIPSESSGSYVPPVPSAPTVPSAPPAVYYIDDNITYADPVPLTPPYQEPMIYQQQPVQTQEQSIKDDCFTSCLWWVSCLFCCVDNR